MIIDAMHCSMEYADSGEQKRSDAKKIFTRAKKQNAWWVTGTEAGAAKSLDLRRALAREADDHGYRFNVRTDTWIAVRRELIMAKSWATGYVQVIEPNQGTGQHGGRGVMWARFAHHALGVITIGCCHYLTDGRRPTQPNYRLNTQMTKAVGTWGREHGKGAQLCFYAGDQNIPDREMDTFRGQPFTSLGDELGKYENTGHGSIDVMASYDHDKRVKGKYWRVLDDSEFHLNTDHFACEGGWDVTALPPRKK